MKKILIFLFILIIITSINAHPKFFKANPNMLMNNETRADSLHGFDVQSYDIWININHSAQSISGAVNAQVMAEENLSSIQYNLVSLTVDSVYVNNSPVNFTHNNGLINIPLSIQSGQLFSTRVVYHGNPVLTNDGYSNGMTFLTQQVFTVSDPNAGRNWWPSYDHPWDKALVNLHIRIRSDWKVACNGIRSSIEQHTDNTSTHHWIGSSPMATYLVSIAAAPYVEVNGTFNNIPLQNFVFSNQATVAQTMFNKLPEMMQIYSDAYGPYPFEKYGNAVANISTFAAMEHQTMTTIGSSLMNGSLSSDYVVAHELAHQWYGNCLTPLTWKDVWLSESFATYSEAVYCYEKFGYEAFCSYVLSSYHNYYRNFAQSYGDRTIYDPIYSEYFYPMVYEKGASVLHMLRAMVGNEDFFDILQTYFTTYHNQNVVTSEFIEIAENISGMDLDQFFDQWIFKKGMPHISYMIMKSENDLSLKSIIKTTSSDPENQFYIKIPLRYQTTTGIDSVLVDSSPTGAITIFTGTQAVQSYSLDPKNWILSLSKTEIVPHLNELLPSNNQIIIGWEPLADWTGVNTFNIYRSQSENGTYQKINNTAVAGLQYIDITAQNGIVYFYKIKAVSDDNYESSPSNILSGQAYDFPMDQGILVVDETRDASGTLLNPTDAQVDDFYTNIFTFNFSSWDCASQGLPTINTMRNYSYIYWHDDDNLSSTITEETQSAFLSYLMAGGKLFISGWKTAEKITNSGLLNRLGITSKLPVNSATFINAESNLYPNLVPDPEKLNSSWNGLFPSVYLFPNVANPVYTAQFTGNPEYQNSPVIVYNHNFALSGIPLYYMQSNSLAQFINPFIQSMITDTDVNQPVKPQNIAISIYPNPIQQNQSMNISAKNIKHRENTLSVFNIKGQLIYEEELISNSKGEIQINWNKTDQNNKALASGVYFIRLKNNEQSVSKKCLIIK